VRSRWFGWSVAALVTTIVVAGARTPGYSQWGDTVSRLASRGQPFSLFASAGLVVYGLLVLAGAPTFRDRLIRWLVGVYGAAAVVAGLAPKDPPGGSPTLTSQVHVDATIVGGIAIIAAMAVVALRASCARTRRLSVAYFVLTGALAIAFRLAWGSPIYGLIERSMLVAAVSWLAMASQTLTSATNVDQTETHSFQTAGG
jgi:hypothetical protein